MTRIYIYPKEVQQLTGKSERYSRDLISKIKKLNQKDKHQLVTIEEFCHYMGLKQELVRSVLKC
jgi:hypothetical protein